MPSANVRIPAVVPVFPLPGVVLFPKALLPLRVFEPRYLAMLEDILDSHGCMAMALFKPGWETGYFESPEVFPVVGVGRVLEYQTAEDGTYRIILMGQRRAEIRGWLPGRPYRIARVVPVAEEEPEAPEAREELRERIRRQLHALIRNDQSIDDDERSVIENAALDADELGFLVDAIAFHFLADAREKQTLLEEADAVNRERLLEEFLARHEELDDDGTSRETGPGEE